MTRPCRAWRVISSNAQKAANMRTRRIIRPRASGWSGSSSEPASGRMRGCRRLQASAVSTAAEACGCSRRQMTRISSKLSQVTPARTTSSTTRRPATSAASPSEAPNAMPGRINAGAQSAEARISTARKRPMFMSIIPAMAGTMGRTGPTKRAMNTLLPPWRQKKSIPRFTRCGYRFKGQMTRRRS
jgi:hypothetical protein